MRILAVQPRAERRHVHFLVPMEIASHAIEPLAGGMKLRPRRALQPLVIDHQQRPARRRGGSRLGGRSGATRARGLFTNGHGKEKKPWTGTEGQSECEN